MVVMRVTAEANLLEERNTRFAFTVLCSASISASSAVPLEPEHLQASSDTIIESELLKTHQLQFGVEVQIESGLAEPSAPRWSPREPAQSHVMI
jgi:hypothetical protein